MQNWHDVAAYRHPLDSISHDALINGVCKDELLGEERDIKKETVSRDKQMVNGTAARITKMQSVGMNKRWHGIQCNEHMNIISTCKMGKKKKK